MFSKVDDIGACKRAMRKADAVVYRHLRREVKKYGGELVIGVYLLGGESVPRYRLAARIVYGPCVETMHGYAVRRKTDIWFSRLEWCSVGAHPLTRVVEEGWVKV